MTGQDITTDLNRIYAAVETLDQLEGQDKGLVIEMSQRMLDDVIEGRGLAEMVTYVKRYCDVIDSAEEAREIAAGI